MGGLLIVDDQDVVRQGIRKMLEEFNLGIQPIYEASDGIEAFRIACDHEPEIILVDIMMPGMDGLELVKELKKAGTKSYIIIISAYNEFNFAKKAIDLKVDNYILKPVTRKELYQSLTAVLGQIRHDNESKEKLGAQQRKYDFLLLYEYLKSKDVFMNVDILYKNTGICNFSEPLFQIVLVKSRQLQNCDMNALKGEMDFKMRSVGGSNISFCPTEQLFVYIFCFNEKDGNIAVEIERRVNSCAGKVLIGVSRAMKGRDTLPELLQQAEAALKECRFKGVSFYKHEDIIKEGTLLIGIVKYNKIIETIRNGMKNELTVQIDDIFFNISKSDHSFEDVRDSFINLVNFIHLNLEGTYDALKISEDFKSAIAFATEFFGLKAAVKSEIERIYNYVCEAQAADVLNPVIRDVLLYIARYFNKDLPLALIANEHNVNYNYLSTLFAKVVGIPFSDYLLKFRLDKAKEFLSAGNCKVYEAAEKAGFKDPKYFCKAFKKLHNMTPAEAIPKYPVSRG